MRSEVRVLLCPPLFLSEYGGVAQLGEHLPCKQGVDSSILFVSTNGVTAEDRSRIRRIEREVCSRGMNLEESRANRFGLWIATSYQYGLIAQVVRAHA